MHCCAFETGTVDGTPSLCTCTRMRGARLYCGYSTGHVRVFDLDSEDWLECAPPPEGASPRPDAAGTPDAKRQRQMDTSEVTI